MADEAIHKSEEEWRRTLTPEQYAVCRQKGTERAFSGAYWDCHEDGLYRCACCQAVLFDAGDKFDSGSGWPSFTRPVAEGRVRTETDRSHGMVRIDRISVSITHESLVLPGCIYIPYNTLVLNINQNKIIGIMPHYGLSACITM